MSIPWGEKTLTKIKQKYIKTLHRTLRTEKQHNLFQNQGISCARRKR